MPALNLLSALAVRENLVRLSFDATVYWSGVLDPKDASRPTRYLLTPDASTLDDQGVPPRQCWPARAVRSSVVNAIDLWTDRRLSGYPSRYSVRVNGLYRADSLSDAVTNNTAEFFGLRAYVPPPLADLTISNRDLANPQSAGLALTDAQLGTYPVDDTGDLARDEGLASWKKRVLRRLTTPKGRYRHLPDYGVLIFESVKALARPGIIDQIAADAEDQIRQEPETVRVRVQVAREGSLVFYRVLARCSFGAVDAFAVPIPFIAL